MIFHVTLLKEDFLPFEILHLSIISAQKFVGYKQDLNSLKWSPLRNLLPKKGKDSNFTAETHQIPPHPNNQDEHHQVWDTFTLVIPW